jgi:hypothetical protein
MNIYPYVYIVTHKTTGEFYIGARWANKQTPDQDFLQTYKTSSKYVTPRINEFTGQILAVFFTKDSAYDYEQELINEHINTNPLCLNRSCYHGKKQFKLTRHSDESKAKMSKAKLGKSRPPMSAETKSKIAAAGRLRPFSDTSKAKVSNANKGRPSPRKGKTLSPEHKAAKSIAAKAYWAAKKINQTGLPEG